MLAVVVTATIPAFGQGNLPSFRDAGNFLIKPGNCGIGDERFGAVQVTREEAIALFGGNEAALEATVGGQGTPKFCVIFDAAVTPEEVEAAALRALDDRDLDRDRNRNNNNGGGGDAGGGGGIAQESEQENESGEVDQSFTVTSEGDNSSQCAGIEGAANTGNSQNQLDLIQYGSTADDFEFDEVGSNVDVSPANTTTCEQSVEQAAAASS